MKLLRSIFAILFVLSAAASANEVKVSQPWARATAPGAKVGAAFADLTAERALRLVRAESPVAQTVELHSMAMEQGVMVMRQVPAIELPAGRTVSLKPGGLHIMLIGLKAPLKVGERVPLRLVLQDAAGKESVLEVQAEVRAMPPGGQPMHH